MLLNSKILGYGDETIIVLHGLYGSLDSWFPAVKFFPYEKYKIHLLDLRNHGESFHSDNFSFPAMIEDMIYYINKFNIDNFSIIGHSLGGKLAMFFADKHPDKLLKLVIADISPIAKNSLTIPDKNTIFHLNLISLISSINLNDFRTYKEIENYLSSFDSKIISVIIKNIKRIEGKFIWKINVEAIRKNLPQIFSGLDLDNYIDKKIEIPTLFLKAENSDYITNNDIKAISFIFANSKIKIIPATDHWLHVEKPSEVAKEIIEFLNI